MMYHCNETPLLATRLSGYDGCKKHDGHCHTEELGHGIKDAAEGLHEIEKGLRELELMHTCEGTQEVRHGIVQVEKAIDELLEGFGGLENNGPGCHEHCKGFDEFVLGVRELRHGADVCCEALGGLSTPCGTHDGLSVLRCGAGEIRLGLLHVTDGLKDLLGFNHFFGLRDLFPAW